jgi:hypothetical protein
LRAAQQVPWQGRIDSGPNWSNAKHRCGAGDDAGPQLVVVFEEVERLVDAARRRLVDSVALRLAFHADHQGATVPFVTDAWAGRPVFS